MKIIKTVAELQAYRASIDASVGFVPTMGALHQGHLSLIHHAKSQCEVTIVSVFVNPTQFLAHEDLSKYPRPIEKDIALCEAHGVDVLFLPDANEIYFDKETIIKANPIDGYILEGHNRPTHFDGVLQVVLKLFNLVRPTKAFFGQKDAQQLYLIQLMAKTLFLPVEIVGCPTLREEDGLAMSSRNIYLSPEERERALAISKALFAAIDTIHNGERKVRAIEDTMRSMLGKVDMLYLAFVDEAFRPLEQVAANTTILIAAKVGNTRLIDNVVVKI